MGRVTRRQWLKVTARGAASAAMTPAILRYAHAADEIRIGALCELSGPASTIGSQQALGIQMAVAEINKTGGVLGKGPGIAGRQVKLLLEDTESKVATGVAKAKKLVERDGVHALTGIIFSPISLGVQEYVNKEARIPFINSGSSSPAVSEPPACGRYSFLSQPSARQYVMASLHAARRHGARWFFLADDFAWGRQSVAFTKDAIKTVMPIQVLGEEYTPFGTTNYAPYITKAVAAKPDVIGIVIFGAGYARALKQLHQMGVGVHKHHYFWSQPDAAAAGEAAVGMTAGETYVVNNPKVPRAEQFARMFRAEHRAWPDPVAARGYTGVELLALAIVRAGSTEPDKIVTALEKTVHANSVHGELRFRECDHTAVASVFIVEGKYDPEDKTNYAAFVNDVENPNALVVPCGQTGCEAAMKG
jgi:branched-chain amino acid transport system substrate-binding protein